MKKTFLMLVLFAFAFSVSAFAEERSRVSRKYSSVTQSGICPPGQIEDERYHCVSKQTGQAGHSFLFTGIPKSSVGHSKTITEITETRSIDGSGVTTKSVQVASF